jgi:hypothetical protein
MRATVASMWIILFCLSLSACASTAKTTGPTAASSPDSAGGGASDSTAATRHTSPGGYWENDGDKDSDDHAHSGELPDDNDDRNLLAPYPDRPSQAELHAITGTVRGYYAAAAAENGAKACGLLDASLAVGLGEGSGRPSHSSSSGCAAAVEHLFKEQHRQLATEEPATMVIISVHVKGDLGLALLGFRKAPEGAILIEREGGIWKVGALFDSEIP